MAERTIVTLNCTVCKNRNYHYAMGKKKTYKIEIKKYCPTCRKHTLHKETK
jgi:large subunit ribosomal protein L33